MRTTPSPSLLITFNPLSPHLTLLLHRVDSYALPSALLSNTCVHVMILPELVISETGTVLGGQKEQDLVTHARAR